MDALDDEQDDLFNWDRRVTGGSLLQRWDEEQDDDRDLPDPDEWVEE